jgi:uncharacterized protein (DUF2235 family)
VAKKIVLFSDGTGNSSAKAEKTNVWRMFQALDQTNASQIAKYDDGVGTSSNKYLAAVGGAFGWGLTRNVLSLYKFVCRNFKRDDKTKKIDEIYAFGFSRGAFTIRVLVDFITTEGLVTFHSDEELNRNAAAAYRNYRSKNFPSWSPFVIWMRWLRDGLLWVKDRIKGYRSYREIAQSTKDAKRAEIPIRFLGLWDTVEAYGMPVDELKRGIDWVLWPMLFGDLILSPRVERACHALSLDDERTTFHPLLWDQVAEARMVAEGKVQRGRITQVWFAGVHSNVGGGYPEDQLSLISLDWMMGEAIANGLVLDSKAVALVGAAKSSYARRYDSRAGFGSYYRYAPRRIEVSEDGQGNSILPIVHGSVVMRIAYGSDHYSPISLPYRFWVLAPDGELLPMEGAPLHMDATKNRQAASAPASVEKSVAVSAEKERLKAAIDAFARPDREAVRLVWDTVFWRRCLYFFTVGTTLILAAYPLLAGVPTQAVVRLLTRIPVVGGHLGDRLQSLSDQLADGTRGPITSVVEALSGFIPGYLQPWTTELTEHPFEFSLIAAAIIVSVLGSNILRSRIHDRARLAWDKSFREDYAKWSAESQKGWRNGLSIALVFAVIALFLAFALGANDLIKLELTILVAGLVVLLGLRSLGRRPAPEPKLRLEQKVEEKAETKPVEQSPPETPLAQIPIRGTFALSVARFLRNNHPLLGIYKWVFKRAVPIAFALLIVVAGCLIVNRAVFDGASAAGFFCKSSVQASERKQEKPSSDTVFTTDKMCWPTGSVLEEGRRYRITLTTPGDWFDRTIRADVAGIPADNVIHWMATPLKRWWRESWFKPIARIGLIGNDEYVLTPEDPFALYSYPSCPGIVRDPNSGPASAKIKPEIARELLKCAPTPDDRKVVVAEIKARTTGELFVYVNDAVLILPRLTDLFFSNNTGTGTIKVERITSSPAPSR